MREKAAKDVSVLNVGFKKQTQRNEAAGFMEPPVTSPQGTSWFPDPTEVQINLLFEHLLLYRKIKLHTKCFYDRVKVGCF